MKTEIIQTLANDFESRARQTENGVEFWLARDLQHLLGYGKWDNFQSVISKAKTACGTAGHKVTDHFADVSKMVTLGSGSTISNHFQDAGENGKNTLDSAVIEREGRLYKIMAGLIALPLNGKGG